MTDEPEDEEIDLGEIEVELDGESEYVECEKGQVIFPHGTAWYADTHGFNALFVEYKTGAITGEDNATGSMRCPSRKPGKVTPIK